MGESGQALDGVIEGIYGTATGETTWTDVFERLCKVIDANAGGITWRFGGATDQHWVGLPPDFNHAYVEHYHKTDPWLIAAGQRAKPGLVIVSHELIAPEALARNPFYAEYCAPNEFRDLCAGFVQKTDDTIVTVGFFQNRASGFSPKQTATIAQLLPHFRRALALGRMAGLVRREADAAWAALDRAPFGVFRVDHGLCVLQVNDAGRQLLSSSVGLDAVGGVLHTWDAADGRTLLRAVAVACGAVGGPGPDALTIQRPVGRPLNAFVVPDSTAPSIRQPHRATLYVVDPEHRQVPPKSAARQAFGLTSAEADLALILCEGVTLKEAAERLLISIHTARTQLKSVLAKTETNRQAELLMVLTRLATGGRQGGAIP